MYEQRITKECIMATNTIVSTRIDQEIKQEAAATLKGVGMTISDAIRLMLTRVAREHVLPFEPHKPNAETIKAMREADAGIGLKSFNTVEELMADLNAED